MLAVGLLLLIVACSDAEAPSQEGPLAGGGGPGEGVGQSLHDSPLGKPFTMGGMVLCTRGDPAVIDKVQPDQQTGSIILEAVGARVFNPAEEMGTNGPGPLPSTMGPIKGFTITMTCPDSPGGDDDPNPSSVPEMAIQISRDGKGSGSINGLKITYHAGDTEYVTLYPYEAVLCDVAEKDKSEVCARTE